MESGISLILGRGSARLYSYVEEMVLYLPVSGRKRLGLNKLFSGHVDYQMNPSARDTAWAITQRDKGARAGVLSLNFESFVLRSCIK